MYIYLIVVLSSWHENDIFRISVSKGREFFISRCLCNLSFFLHFHYYLSYNYDIIIMSMIHRLSFIAITLFVVLVSFTSTFVKA